MTAAAWLNNRRIASLKRNIARAESRLIVSRSQPWSEQPEDENRLLDILRERLAQCEREAQEAAPCPA